MRRLLREQWQNVLARLRHDRHARRVTSQLLLDVQDKETSRLAESLLRNAGGPMEEAKIRGAKQLEHGRAVYVSKAEAFDRHRAALDLAMQQECARAERVFGEVRSGGHDER
jgi:hypothetical protein